MLIYTFPTRSDGDNIYASHLNSIQAAVTAISTEITTGMLSKLTIMNAGYGYGVGLNIPKSSTDPDVGELVTGDLWHATSGRLKLYTGTAAKEIAFTDDVVTGPAGPTGATGPQGPQGLTGPQGPQGDQGPTGATGPQGPQGIQGLTGPTGARGADGYVGADGAQGATGPTGATGPQGPQGIQGPQGDIGPTGATGPQGPQGIQGLTGPTGATGATGPTGTFADPGSGGLLSRTALSTYTPRTITAATNGGITVTNGDGVSGNPSIAITNLGTANGVATLDSGGKVPVSQLPNSIMEYQGLWNAATNTTSTGGSLADGTGNNGDVYRVSVASSARNLGSGNIEFAVGDYVIYNGSTWEKADTTDAVSSIFGRTGNVTAQTNDYTWAQIDKTTSSLADIASHSHTLLTDKGSNTHDQIDNALTRLASTSGTNTGDQIVPANTTSTSNQFFSAYNSTTGAFTKSQPALSGLSDATITTAASGNFLRYNGTAWVNATIGASDIPLGVSATKIADGSVGNTQFQYLSGVTSDIQTQFGAKASLSGPTFTGLVILNASSTSAASLRIPSGTAPTTPIAGDLWQTTGALKFYTGSATKSIPFTEDLVFPSNTTATTNQFLSAYNSSTGAFTKAQPALSGLSDVTITAAASGDFLRHNGTAWVDATILASDLPTGIDATKIADGTVTSTEFQYLGSVTSDIQTQLNAKAALAGPTFTGTPSAPTAAADTNSTQLATTAFVIGQAASTNPVMDGTVAVGTSLKYARADHVHASDTAKASLNGATFTGAVTVATPTASVQSVIFPSGAADPSTPTSGSVWNKSNSLYFYNGTSTRTFAFLDSPTFTGTPAAPTANADTNTTQLATTAYVVGQASSSNPVMDGSVAVGTSLKYARADHVHPSDTTKASLAGATYTGAITAATPSASVQSLILPSGAADPSTPTSGGIWNKSNALYFYNGTATKTLAFLESPTFTGTPASTTAAADTNSTQIATTAYVVGQASSSTPVMNGVAAVGTSLKYARADHVHATDTSLAPLASPALTGTPTSTTAAADTNTTQIATTAFVIGQAGSSNPVMNGTVAVGTSKKYSREDHVHGSDTSKASLSGATFTGAITAAAPTTSVQSLIMQSGAADPTTPNSGSIWNKSNLLYFYNGTTTRTFAFLDSPTFTGTPASTTAAADTNTTQIATTAFVIGQAGSSNPVMNGSVAVGTSKKYSREDHVHPSDTTKASLSGGNGALFTGAITTATPTTSVQSLILASGSADPTTPTSGSLWNNTNVLKYYNGSAAKTVAFLDSALTPSSISTSTFTFGSGTGPLRASSGTVSATKITLSDTTNDVTGTLGIGSGGTNITTYTLGDILYSSATNTLSKLAGNTTATKNFLSQTGTGSVSAAPSWATIAADDLSDVVITSAAQGDTLIYNGSSRFVNTTMLGGFTLLIGDGVSTIATGYQEATVMLPYDCIPTYWSSYVVGGTSLTNATCQFQLVRTTTGNYGTTANPDNGLTGSSSSVSTTTVTSSTTLTASAWVGYTIMMLTGTGANSYGTITANTTTTITVSSWTGTQPSGAGTYLITNSGSTGGYVLLGNGLTTQVFNSGTSFAYGTTTANPLKQNDILRINVTGTPTAKLVALHVRVKRVA